MKHKLFLFLLAIALLGGALAPAQSALAGECRKTYTVRPGDTLANIAIKYNVRFEELTKPNKLYSPSFTIYVGQVLCIPADSKPPAGFPNSANTPAADFTARIRDKTLTVTTSNFPRSSGYYVKVGTSGKGGQKIGLLNTAKGGSIQGNFTLPDKLRTASQVTVCLKNNVTDANVCRVVRR